MEDAHLHFLEELLVHNLAHRAVVAAAEMSSVQKGVGVALKLDVEVIGVRPRLGKGAMQMFVEEVKCFIEIELVPGRH